MFFVLLASICFGSEIMSKGEVLKQDSVVFTVEEAERLKARILELEKKEKDLEIYKDLYSLEQDKCNIYSDSIDLFKIKEKTYLEMNEEYKNIIDQKNKELRLNGYENVGYFALGAVTIIGSFYMTSGIINSQN